MNFREYSTQAESTLADSVRNMDPIGRLSYFGLGLGEAGEVQGKIKKILRDSNGILTEEKVLEIAGELGDVLWYLTMIARTLGVPLDAVARQNLAKLADRADRGVIAGSGDNR